jgi:hypothetical protein
MRSNRGYVDRRGQAPHRLFERAPEGAAGEKQASGRSLQAETGKRPELFFSFLEPLLQTR